MWMYTKSAAFAEDPKPQPVEIKPQPKETTSKETEKYEELMDKQGWWQVE